MSKQFEEKVLFVDDDENILAALQRQFRGKLNMVTANNGQAGIDLLKAQGPFAVVLSDMNMPEMNGIQFLSKAHEISKDTVRIMLTGNADLETAMHAVNEGNIFRFLVKPCHQKTIEWALESGIKQYRLVKAEQVLLEKTLKGSVNLLTDMLALVSPIAFSRASRVKRYMRQMVVQLELEKTWQYDLAAMLSQIGCVALPADLLAKVYAGDELTSEEEALYRSHPQTGQALLARIPRLEAVARIIAGQFRSYKEDALPDDKISDIPEIVGAQLLRAALDFDTLIARGHPKSEALGELRRYPDEYHPLILNVFRDIAVVEVDMQLKVVRIADLNGTMVLAEDVRTNSGILLAAKGLEVSRSMRARFEAYALRKEIDSTVRVLVPMGKVQQGDISVGASK